MAEILDGTVIEPDNISKNKLKSVVDKIENLEDQKEGISEDISDVYKEAKFFGFNTSVIKKIIRMRKMDQEKLTEEEHLLDLYKNALGM